MVERYEIRSKIAQGGVGAVYLAWDTNLEREVAIKRLLPPEESEMEEESAEASLMKEAGALSKLQHPNVVTVYDVGVDKDGAFVIMEYIDGGDLEDVVEKAPMTEDDCRSLATQCLEGLVAAGDLSLMHRDIKPSNIMLRWLPSGQFEAKLLDFGLAKFSSQPSLQTLDQSNNILGSIYFIAPEQFETKPLDSRTDLYAFGCVLYFCLTQKYPFDGDNAANVMMSHLEHKFTPLAQLRPDLSAPFVQWVERLMSKEVEDRPADARAALGEIETLRADDGEVLIATLSDEAEVAAALPVAGLQLEKKAGKKLLTEAVPAGKMDRYKLAPRGNTTRAAVTSPAKTSQAVAVAQSEEDGKRKLAMMIGGGMLGVFFLVLTVQCFAGGDEEVRAVEPAEEAVVEPAEVVEPIEVVEETPVVVNLGEEVVHIFDPGKGSQTSGDDAFADPTHYRVAELGEGVNRLLANDSVDDWTLDTKSKGQGFDARPSLVMGDQGKSVLKFERFDFMRTNFPQGAFGADGMTVLVRMKVSGGNREPRLLQISNEGQKFNGYQVGWNEGFVLREMREGREVQGQRLTGEVGKWYSLGLSLPFVDGDFRAVLLGADDGDAKSLEFEIKEGNVTPKVMLFSRYASSKNGKPSPRTQGMFIGEVGKVVTMAGERTAAELEQLVRDLESEER